MLHFLINPNAVPYYQRQFEFADSGIQIVLTGISYLIVLYAFRSKVAPSKAIAIGLIAALSAEIVSYIRFLHYGYVYIQYPSGCFPGELSFAPLGIVDLVAKTIIGLLLLLVVARVHPIKSILVVFTTIPMNWVIELVVIFSAAWIQEIV